MAFDPAKPQIGSDLDAVEIRDQLNALKALIDAVPAGPPGPACGKAGQAKRTNRTQGQPDASGQTVP